MLRFSFPPRTSTTIDFYVHKNVFKLPNPGKDVIMIAPVQELRRSGLSLRREMLPVLKGQLALFRRPMLCNRFSLPDGDPELGRYRCAHQCKPRFLKRPQSKIYVQHRM